MRYNVNINEFRGNIRKLKDSFRDGKEIEKELSRLGKLFAKQASQVAASKFDVGDSGGGIGELVDVTKRAFSVIITSGKRVTLIYPYEKVLDQELITSKSPHNPRSYPSYWRFARYGTGLSAKPINVIGVAAQRYVSKIGRTSIKKFGGYLLGYYTGLTDTLLSPFNPFVKKFQQTAGRRKVANLIPVYHPGYEGFDWFDQSDAGNGKRRKKIEERIETVTQRIIDRHFKESKKSKRKARR